MEIAVNTENKQLIKLHERFLCVAQTADAFKNDVAALKVCLKLTALEIKSIKKSKQPVDGDKLNRVLWQYVDLSNTLKFLIKTKNIQDVIKGCADIRNMVGVAERQIAELKGESAVGNLSAASQKIVSAINGAVSSKLEGLKKMFAGEESSQSE